jgi:hypothetical protein
MTDSAKNIQSPVKVILCASYSISFKLEAFSTDLERSKQEKEGRKKETTTQAAFARGFKVYPGS